MQIKNKTVQTFSNLIYYISIIGFFIILLKLGFNIGYENTLHLRLALLLLLSLMFSVYALKYLYLLNHSIKRTKLIWNGLFSVISIIITLFFIELIRNYTELDYISRLLAHAVISIVFIVEISKRSFNYDWLSINPRILFVLSFITLILVGALLLMLPRATTSGIHFVDALFTSTSAVCVTGLTVIDTQFAFTRFGQIIILILIQIGGLGIMTFSSFLGIFFIKRTTFRNQMVMQDFVGSENFNDAFKTVIKIVVSTLIIEIIGAISIFVSIDNSLDFSISEKLFFSVFHSISAFCNAGFSTLSENLANIHLKFNYNFMLIISFLIILGGIGFHVFINFYSYIKHFIKNIFKQIFYKEKFHHLPWVININTIIVIISTIFLLILGTVIIYLFEYHHILSEHTAYGKIITAFFSSVTARTAGFNTFNFSQLYSHSILIILFLMWVGASPGSTGGGIKTSTFFIAVLNVFCLSQGKDRIEFLWRKISNISVRRAYAVLFLSLVVISASSILILSFEENESMLAVFFETVSAYGTAGLSLGITPTLSAGSKLVLIFTMFFGRVGMLTVLIGLFTPVKTLNYQYPKEEIIVL